MTTTTNPLPSLSTCKIEVNAFLPELDMEEDYVIGFEFDAPKNSTFLELFDIGSKVRLRNVHIVSDIPEGLDQDYQLQRDDLKRVFCEENYGIFYNTANVEFSDRKV